MGKPRKQRQAPRIQHIELSEKNTTLRWIVAGVLLVIGLVAIAVGVNSCVSTEAGWQEVKTNSNRLDCSADFVFNYHFGQGDMDPTSEMRNLTQLYNEAAEKAWQLFNTDVDQVLSGSLSYLNDHPNEAVKLDSALYDALRKAHQSGTRYLYLAAVYDEYDRIFASDSEVNAADRDPARNKELLPYIQEAAAFANDPAAVDLEFLDGGKVRLNVSQAYLAFTETYGIYAILDFGWMKNAFIADYLAQRFIDSGFTNGYLVSYDGFTRNLDTGDGQYSLNLFDRLENNIYIPAILGYRGPMSIVSLRDYPMSARDAARCYLYPDGQTVTAHIDPTDGMSKRAADNLVGYSQDASCADIALKLAPLFIADSLDTDALIELSNEELFCIWFEGEQLCYSQKDAQIDVQTVEGASYQKKYAGK